MAVKKSPSAQGSNYGSSRKGPRRKTGSSAARPNGKKSAAAANGFRQKSAKVLDNVTETVNSLSFTTKIVAGLIVMAVAVTGLVSLTKSQLTINEKQKILDDLDMQIAQQELDNEELKARLNQEDSEYIETYAREKLGMVKPGERVYINIVGE